MIASGNSAAIANPLPGASPAIAAAADRLPMPGINLNFKDGLPGTYFIICRPMVRAYEVFSDPTIKVIVLPV